MYFDISNIPSIVNEGKLTDKFKKMIKGKNQSKEERDNYIADNDAGMLGAVAGTMYGGLGLGTLGGYMVGSHGHRLVRHYLKNKKK
jgi:predicted lipid-binding transport protein (Tim44 family)